jgi:hypothetical protein
MPSSRTLPNRYFPPTTERHNIEAVVISLSWEVKNAVHDRNGFHLLLLRALKQTLSFAFGVLASAERHRPGVRAVRSGLRPRWQDLVIGTSCNTTRNACCTLARRCRTGGTESRTLTQF